MSVVEVTGLSKDYGKVRAIHNLSFSLEENKITGLIGRNGAGKTTLLKLIAGYLKASDGAIRVFGENPLNSLKVAANLIFIDDNMVFPTTLNLAEILEAAAGFYPNWDMGLAQGLFDYFDFNPKIHHQHLSKGTKSTFNMIIGLAAKCALTVFDEPTTGMDAAVRKDFYKALLKDYLEYPRSIILSSHLVNEIEDVLEEILLIKDGIIGIHSPVEDLRSMAVGLRGKAHIIKELIEHREVMHQEGFGKDSLYAVVKHNFAVQALDKARLAGVDVTPVAIDDLCVYLTAKTKGGIEDVFKRD